MAYEHYSYEMGMDIVEHVERKSLEVGTPETFFSLWKPKRITSRLVDDGMKFDFELVR